MSSSLLRLLRAGLAQPCLRTTLVLNISHSGRLQALFWILQWPLPQHSGDGDMDAPQRGDLYAQGICVHAQGQLPHETHHSGPQTADQK